MVVNSVIKPPIANTAINAANDALAMIGLARVAIMLTPTTGNALPENPTRK
jgi:hypothetical protein